MGFITDFIDWIVNFFTTIWDFIVGFFEIILMLFKYLDLALQLALNLIGSMPSWLQGFGLATITISVLFVILGRDTGGQKQ